MGIVLFIKELYYPLSMVDINSELPQEINNRVSYIIDFYFKFQHLKEVYRQGWLDHGIPKEQCESVADHSFAVAVLSYIIAGEKGLDRDKAMKLGLFHDIPEAIIGDKTPRDNITPDQKRSSEIAACQILFAGFPDQQEYLNLIREYQFQSTPEAKLVYQIDKLERMAQAQVYQENGFKGLEEFFEEAPTKIHDPDLQEMVAALMRFRRKKI